MEQNIQSSSPPTFSTLPPSVLDLILEYLDPKSLLKVRLLNSHLKSLVNRPPNIQRIQLSINSSPTNSRRDDVIFNSTVPWTNVLLENPLVFQDRDTAATSSAVAGRPELVQKFIAELKIIRIKNLCQLFPQFLELLQKVSPQLNSLRVFDQGVLGNSNWEVEYEKNASLLTKNLSGLKSLTFETEHRPPSSPTLQLQRISDSWARQFLSTQVLKSLFELLIHFVLEIPKTSSEQHAVHLSEIHFSSPTTTECPRLSKLERRTYWDTHYSNLNDNSPSMLGQNLVQLCAQLGIKLFDFPASALPTTQELTPVVKGWIDSCVQSVGAVIHEQGFGPKLYFPNVSVNLVVQLTVFQEDETNDGAGVLKQVDLPDFSLNSLTLIAYRSVRHSERLISSLLSKCRRQSVMELNFNADGCHSSPWDQLQFSVPFPNLRKLFIYKYPGLIDLKIMRFIVEGLEELEEVTLAKCRLAKNCSDFYGQLAQTYKRLSIVRFIDGRVDFDVGLGRAFELPDNATPE